MLHCYVYSTINKSSMSMSILRFSLIFMNIKIKKFALLAMGLQAHV